MKRMIVFSLVLGLTGCAMFQGRRSVDAKPDVRELDVPVAARDEDGPVRQRLVVLPFLDEKPERPKNIAEEARKGFVRDLSQSGRFVILAHQDLPQDVTGMKDSDGGYAMEAIAKSAAPLGAAAVIEGKILEVQVRKNGDAVGIVRKLRAKVVATVRVRMFSARNGKELLNQIRTAEVEDSSTRVAGISSDRVSDEDPGLVRQAVRNAFASSLGSAMQVLEKLTWEGRVALISGERVFLNAGRLSGLQIGDILKITDEGDEVYDPQSGHFIGKAPGRMKGTVEVVSYFGKDGAIAVVHSGSGFKENDRVELY